MGGSQSNWHVAPHWAFLLQSHSLSPCHDSAVAESLSEDCGNGTLANEVLLALGVLTA